jgi:hypothetical protein
MRQAPDASRQPGVSEAPPFPSSGRSTDWFVNMASMEFTRPRLARLSGNQPSPWLLAATELGIGLGDRFEVSQGDSGLFKGGVRLADETA